MKALRCVAGETGEAGGPVAPLGGGRRRHGARGAAAAGLAPTPVKTRLPVLDDEEFMLLPILTQHITDAD